jgi:TonB-linked SusC/RagA family outer membrane protein
MRRLVTLVVAGLLVTSAYAPLEAQSTGTITGQVTDQSTGRPLGSVQVFVAGTNRNTLSNAEGRYVLTGVPAGEQRVQAELIGYSGASATVTVAAGGTATADFQLSPSAVALEGLVVTATGEQRRREVGSTVATIAVENVDLAPVSTMSQLLQGRAAGVTVMQSAGTSGTGARVRIRGQTSISLSNEPLLIVDGVQVDNNPESFAFGLGGQSISRLNDISPEEIESIEILKGPAAAALYGTAAANGVIQITTKRGRAGDARWNVWTEYGQLKDVTDYPANWLGRGTNADGATVNCRVHQAAAGTCTPTEALSWNPLEEVPPFRTGINRTVGMSVAGGSDRVQYFLSGGVDKEDGIYKSNEVDRINMRANLDARITEDLDASVKIGYNRADLALPGNDNNTFGFIGAGLLGSAVDDSVRRGYFSFPNEYRFALERLQTTHRLIASADANWRPLTWLTISGTGGMDMNDAEDVAHIDPGIWSPAVNPDNAMGNRTVVSGLRRVYTGRTSAVGTFQLNPELTSTTTIGGEVRQERWERVSAGGFRLLPGTGTLGGASERFSVGELDRTERTLSVLGSQQFGWRDRVFVTAGVRGDRSSNFGQQFGFQWYPSLSGSWVISEEDFFPQSDALSSLRLRGAWGRAGLMPGFRTAQQFFSSTVATIQGESVPAVTIGGAGNVDLKPEEATEWEIGFDAGFFNDRLGLEVAYYSKDTRNALVSRRLAPSLGSSTTQTVNLGKVSNSGFEAMLNALIVSMNAFDWDAQLSFSTNSNELVQLGEGIEPIIFGIGADSQRHAEGLPLGHYYGTELISWSDANGDGFIGTDEVELSEPKMLGRAFPTREISLANTFTFFDRVRVSALFDHKGGHQLFNSTEEFRCNSFQNCEGLNNPNAPLKEQARAVAALLGSIDPYVEDADYIKLRELSVTLIGIENWLGQAGVRGLRNVSLTVAGRNLATWTNYGGLDPEMNSGGQSNFSTYEFLGQPPVRSWTIRLNVGF